MIDAAHFDDFGVVDRRGKGGRGRLQPLGQFAIQQPGDPPRGNPECGRCQFPGGNRRHPVRQLVCFVDDQQRVFGQDGGLRNGIDGQQRVVGDDDIGGAGPAPRPFGEALGAERATGHAHAFSGGDADLGPRSVRHTGLEVVAVTGVGRRGPGGEPLHVTAQCGGRHRVEQFFLRPVLFGVPLTRSPLNITVDFVEAQVVPPPLE